MQCSGGSPAAISGRAASSWPAMMARSNGLPIRSAQPGQPDDVIPLLQLPRHGSCGVARRRSKAMHACHARRKV
jgi:hypothetical protein